MTIELVSQQKVGLTLANPVMPAAGCFGYGGQYEGLVELDALGGVVYGPVTARSRRGAPPPRTLTLPAGVLLHTGLANPGVARVLRWYERVWGTSPVPVIIHVAGTSPGETGACCRRLAGVEAVAGIELGLADTVTFDDAAALIEAAREASLRPLIVRLPLLDADLLADVAVKAGADALTVAAPPRGTLWHVARQRFVTGRLYGPATLPQAVRAVRQVSAHVAVPVIGCGGVCTVDDALMLLQAGAVAVQVDAALWRDPAVLACIARGLAERP